VSAKPTWSDNESLLPSRTVNLRRNRRVQNINKKPFNRANRRLISNNDVANNNNRWGNGNDNDNDNDFPDDWWSSRRNRSGNFQDFDVHSAHYNIRDYQPNVYNSDPSETYNNEFADPDYNFKTPYDTSGFPRNIIQGRPAPWEPTQNNIRTYQAKLYSDDENANFGSISTVDDSSQAFLPSRSGMNDWSMDNFNFQPRNRGGNSGLGSNNGRNNGRLNRPNNPLNRRGRSNRNRRLRRNRIFL